MDLVAYGKSFGQWFGIFYETGWATILFNIGLEESDMRLQLFHNGFVAFPSVYLFTDVFGEVVQSGWLSSFDVQFPIARADGLKLILAVIEKRLMRTLPVVGQNAPYVLPVDHSIVRYFRAGKFSERWQQVHRRDQFTAFTPGRNVSRPANNRRFSHTAFIGTALPTAKRASTTDGGAIIRGKHDQCVFIETMLFEAL